MRIMIYISERLTGGGLQVALSILNELQYFTENEYHICLSKKILLQIPINIFSYIKYYILDSTSILRISSRMNKLEKKIKPDVVFSVFAPTYWRPRNKHIAGFAIPHYIYSDSPFFKMQLISDKIKLLIKN